MSDLISKISSYNLFNYLFPGVIFTVLLKYLVGIDLFQKEILVGVFIYYFIGAIISRVGSLIIEPLFKKICIIEFAKYDDFLKAEKEDKKIADLLEISNMYRTIISLFFMLILIKIYLLIQVYIPLLNTYKNGIVILLLFILFIISYRKQVNFIKKRVDNFINN